MGKTPSNSLLTSEAVPSVSFQRVMFPLTVIADPASVSPRNGLDLLIFAKRKKDGPALGAVGRNSRGFQ